jgi:Na+/H+ antiporter NhaD/arsenite permease-like protein
MSANSYKADVAFLNKYTKIIELVGPASARVAVAPGLQGRVMTSTLAGNLTIVGSVANLIVLELAGTEGRVGFFRFLRYGVVITAVTTALGLAVLLAEMRLGL